MLSTSVRSPITGLAVSNGLRPGLAMFAKKLAAELGPRGVRVNGLLPGRVDTERVRELDDTPRTRRGPPGAGGSDPAAPLRLAGGVRPGGRLRALPAASYLTGAMLPVDGGASRSL